MKEKTFLIFTIVLVILSIGAYLYFFNIFVPVSTSYNEKVGMLYSRCHESSCKDAIPAVLKEFSKECGNNETCMISKIDLLLVSMPKD